MQRVTIKSLMASDACPDVDHVYSGSEEHYTGRY